MTRVLSAVILLTVVIGSIWFVPMATLWIAVAAALVAFLEYAELARALGARIPRVVTGAAVLTSCLAIASTAISPFDVVLMNGLPESNVVGPPAPLDIVLLSAMIVIGAVIVGSRTPGTAVLLDVGASVLPILYIGLPVGALVSILWIGGRGAMLLLLVIIVVSDSAQYYTGRAVGRHPLAPAISPKKTVEGAIGGIVCGTLATSVGGFWVFHGPHPVVMVLLGATISALGIVGDLFESLLKRSAGVKDSGTLIPGHGGVLDRIDSWLFAAPVYYTFVRYLQ